MNIGGVDLQELIVHIGVWVTFLIIFAESGLLIGFFLPGDSLIFTAGLLASQGHFNIWYFLLGGSIAAIVGDNVGYAFGRRFGPRIFSRDDSWLFKKDHVEKARDFYEKHGPLTIVLARFTPVVRTFAPILAGVGKMNYRTFLTYNIIGGLVWVWGLGWLGYGLGDVAQKNNIEIDKYILPVLILIIVASILPGVITAVRSKKLQLVHVVGSTFLLGGLLAQILHAERLTTILFLVIGAGTLLFSWGMASFRRPK